jgi:hypothetical protein
VSSKGAVLEQVVQSLFTQAIAKSTSVGVKMHISPSQDIHGAQPVLQEEPEKDLMLWLV